MNNDKETYLVLADFHWKHVNKNSLSLAHQIAKDLKPDVLVSLGDSADYEGISKFTLKEYGDGVNECEKELKAFKIGWKELLVSAGHPKEIILLGNHDGQRVEKMLAKLKAKKKTREYNDVKRALDFREHFPNAKVIDYNKFYKKNDLLLTHGEFHNANHTKTHAQRYCFNMLYGHIHSFSVYTMALKAIGKVITATSMPCMCNLNPEYLGNRSNSWVNGLAVVTFYNGTHNIEIVQFKKNKAMFRGKLYTA